MNKPKYLELTPADLEKVRLRQEREDKEKLSTEWRLLGEFGFYFGYAAVEAVRNNDIDIESFNKLLSGARKANAQQIIDYANAMYAADLATKSKNPEAVLRQGLKVHYDEVAQ